MTNIGIGDEINTIFIYFFGVIFHSYLMVSGSYFWFKSQSRGALFLISITPSFHLVFMVI